MGCINKGGIGTGNKGCVINPLQQTTVLFFDKEQTFENTVLQDKLALEQLIYSATDRMSILTGANYVETKASESEFSQPKYGAKLKTTESSPSRTLKFVFTECLKKFANKIDGTTAHVLFITEGGYVEGIRVENDKLKTAKVTVNVTDEVIDDVIEYKNFSFDFDKLFDSIKKYVKLPYEISEIELLTGYYLYPKTAETDKMLFEVTDCDDNLRDGIDVADFEIYDYELGGVRASTITDEGNGSYLATYNNPANVGDILEPRYIGVMGATKLFIQVETSKIETV